MPNLTRSAFFRRGMLHAPTLWLARANELTEKNNRPWKSTLDASTKCF